MAKLSKRVRAFREKVDPAKQYPIGEAVTILNDLSSVKFKESIDVSINLGVDPRKSDQVVRGATVLPNGTGKTVRVAVFAQGDKATEASDAGADVVGMEPHFLGLTRRALGRRTCRRWTRPWRSA